MLGLGPRPDRENAILHASGIKAVAILARISKSGVSKGEVGITWSK